MTPFCTADPNEATTGFRFWSAGYWSNLLGKRPYHISALFVIDLRLFRMRAYGEVPCLGARSCDLWAMLQRI